MSLLLCQNVTLSFQSDYFCDFMYISAIVRCINFQIHCIVFTITVSNGFLGPACIFLMISCSGLNNDVFIVGIIICNNDLILTDGHLLLPSSLLRPRFCGIVRNLTQ